MYVCRKALSFAVVLFFYRTPNLLYRAATARQMYTRGLAVG